MPKKNHVKIKCPSCQRVIEKKKLDKVNSLIPFDGFTSFGDRSHLESFMETVGRHSDFYQWACDDCIKNKQAILANPKKQYFTFKHPMDTGKPYLAYFDKSFTCKNCGAKFVFSKEEQKHWYEELSFVVYAKPNTCKECRKDERASKRLNQELSDLLREGEPKEKSELLRIAEIYQEMGKIEKMKKYLKAGNKR